MNISGIYRIQSTIKPERYYIGSAVNVSARWKLHLNSLKRKDHHSSKLQNHFNKYGESDLQFSVLLGCEKKDLIKHEQFFIDSYKPYFNICPLAGNSLGYKHTEKTIKYLKERIISEETRQKMRGTRGPMSEENKLKHKGKAMPMLGKHPSEETLIKLRRPKGPMSEEARNNMSIARKRDGIIPPSALGLKRSDETIKRMSESRRGKPSPLRGKPGRILTEEAKMKISQSLVTYFKKRIA